MLAVFVVDALDDDVNDDATIREHLDRIGADGYTILEHVIEPEVVEYLKTPPNAERLGQILDQLGLEPRQLMRHGEAIYGELKLDDPALDRDALIAAMVEHPILIERPVVLSGAKAALGRPPESVLKIL